MEFTGETVWMNPYGHLPGELYGFLPFYGWMCVVYIIAAVGWFFLNFVYWKELLQVSLFFFFLVFLPPIAIGRKLYAFFSYLGTKLHYICFGHVST